MKLLLIIFIVGLATVILIGGGQFMPISKNLVHYLLWRTTASGTAHKGIVRTGGTNIHYRSYGSGPPVLLLHGGLSNRLSWFSQVPWLVEAGRQVILIDSRGHGDSDLGDKDLSYRLLANDSIQVLDQMGVEHTAVIGWSDGANTALLLALYWPQRVTKIVAISGNFDPSGIKPEAKEEDNIQSSGLTYWFKRWWTGAGEKFLELENKIKKLWQSSPRLSAKDLHQITAPVMVIVGEHDMISLEHAKKMAELLPHGVLEIIKGGGHATLITHASKINNLIRAFLVIPDNP